MPQLLNVFVRHVYGQPKVYPANATAQKFADLLEVKTFAHRQLQAIEGLGFVINQVSDPAAKIVPEGAARCADGKLRLVD